MMKKYLALFLCAILLLSLLTACSEKEAALGDAPDAAPIVGGWTKPESPVVTDEIKALLDKALEGLVGAEYTPVAYLGSQVVAGKNHAVLCKVAPVVPNPESTYAIVTLYEKPDGSVELTGVTDSNVKTNTGKELSGGWTDADSPVIPEDLKVLLDKALESYLGVDYTPVALLSSQVVAGMNYCVFCEAKVVRPDAEPGYAFVYLYKDLDGNGTVTEIVDFPAGS